MADFSNLKKKNRFGTPPLESAIKNNLQLPEVMEPIEQLIDGRSLRKTGRTKQLATRVKDEFYKKVKRMAFEREITIAELLETAIDSLEK